LNGRTDTQLTPGLWVISVYAAGNANVRYRLILSSGNSATNGLVQDLPLDGSVKLTNALAGGDWRYYRVQIPTNAPNNLLVIWTSITSRTSSPGRPTTKTKGPTRTSLRPAGSP
jgi:hypothetical protein